MGPSPGMTSNKIFAFTLDVAPADGKLMDCPQFERPGLASAFEMTSLNQNIHYLLLGDSQSGNQFQILITSFMESPLRPLFDLSLSKVSRNQKGLETHAPRGSIHSKEFRSCMSNRCACRVAQIGPSKSYYPPRTESMDHD
jgi:hypothetical protein